MKKHLITFLSLVLTAPAFAATPISAPPLEGNVSTGEDLVNLANDNRRATNEAIAEINGYGDVVTLDTGTASAEVVTNAILGSEYGIGDRFGIIDDLDAYEPPERVERVNINTATTNRPDGVDFAQGWWIPHRSEGDGTISSAGRLVLYAINNRNIVTRIRATGVWQTTGGTNGDGWIYDWNDETLPTALQSVWEAGVVTEPRALEPNTFRGAVENLFGAFGLGDSSISDKDRDAAGLTTEFFRANVGANNPTSSPYHTINISRLLDAQGAQISIRDGSASDLGVMTFRHRDPSGSWSNDHIVWHDQNFNPDTVNVRTGLTGSANVVADWAGDYFVVNNTATATITVPVFSNTLETGSRIDFKANTANDVTFLAAAGVTINSKDGNLTIDGQHAAATLIYLGSDIWDLIGALK